MKRVIHVFCVPVHWLADHLHARQLVRNKRVVHITGGVVIVVIGSELAALGHHCSCEALTRTLDVTGYWLHALGGAPLLKVVAEILEIEL